MNRWQTFFRYEAPIYDQECFTKNTEAEIAFLKTELGVPAGARILDMGCGTGRHSVPLAQHGFAVTGVDLSRDMLDVAARRAKGAGVEIEFVQENAETFSRPGAFDAAICLCEGAFSLLGAREDYLTHDAAILSNIARSLRKGGRFVATMLNACRMIRRYSDADVAEGKFDVMRMTEVNRMTMKDGTEIELYERGYTPPELELMLYCAGFDIDGIYGGTAGAWNKQAVSLDEFELMVIARATSRAPRR
ncbi:methyltransferase domain-containing protein [bacterium]|nr:methyltransferase domain-containing protein [bacterium]